MRPLSLRARLTLLQTGIIGICLLAFTAAAYVFLRSVEMRRVDLMMEEQSEIMDGALEASGARSLDSVNVEPGVFSVLRDLRARSIRVVVLDSAHRPRVSTRAVHDSEGAGEERHVLGRPVDSAALVRALDRLNGAETFSLHDSEPGLRGHADTVTLGGRRYLVVLTTPLRDVSTILERARTVALIALPTALLLAAAGGWVIARRSLSPLREMANQAGRIQATNIHDRLQVPGAAGELGELATSFNALLERLELAFDQQRRFMADASHELRTPVAILRGEADVALSAPSRTPEEYRDALAVVRDAGERLTRTVNDLFLLARVDAGQLPVIAVPLYLDEVVSDCARAVRTLAQRRGVAVHVDVEGDLPYVADEDLLRRLVLNLLDNAIKYSQPGASVTVSLRSSGGWHCVTVADTGMGISPDAQPHVFDRFYRADKARARTEQSDAGSGTGLGLSIARWVAEVHGGTLELAKTSAEGSTFELRLPAEPEHQRPVSA